MTEVFPEQSSVALERLPRREFVGPNANPLMNMIVNGCLDEPRELLLPPENPKSPERVEQLTAINDAYIQFGQDMGVDLSRRMLSNDRVHLFDPEAFDQLRQQFGRTPGWRGAQLNTGDLIVLDDPAKPAHTLGFINHERGHHAEATFIRTVENADGQWDPVRSRRGFTVENNHAFGRLEEVVVEKGSQLIEARYWPQYPALSEFVGKTEGGYIHDMPVMDAMVDKIAAHRGVAPDDVWLELIRGNITGDMRALRQIYDTFGTDGMRAVAFYKDKGDAMPAMDPNQSVDEQEAVREQWSKSKARDLAARLALGDIQL